MTKCIRHPQELSIIQSCGHCDEVTIASLIRGYNKLAVGQKRGVDKFFLTQLSPDDDISRANIIEGRYAIIGSNTLVNVIYETYLEKSAICITETVDHTQVLCANAPALTLDPISYNSYVPSNPGDICGIDNAILATTRKDLAAAIEIYVQPNYEGHPLVETPEFKQALMEGRVTYWSWS